MTKQQLDALAYAVEQQGQGVDPILNKAARELRKAGEHRHKFNVAERDNKRLRALLAKAQS